MTYVATVFAKPESADQVADLYRERISSLAEAPGFVSARVLRAQPGKMIEAVRAHAAKQGNPLDEHGHAESGPEGIHFVMVEEWENEEARVEHARSADQQRANAAVIPHLLPEHTHEFYTELSAK